MKQPEPELPAFDLEESIPARGLHRFSHAAMATVFEVRCAHADSTYARQAAQAAFDLADRLELELSRFVENSDISRVNHLSAGETARVSPWTMDCLAIARLMYAETGEAFDVSIGTGLDSLELEPEEFAVHARTDGVRLDLGGIGKGYAVDRMAESLEDWEILHALIHAGFSSVRALEPPPDREGWPLTLSMPDPDHHRILARIPARRQALSASGIRKTDHIIDPRTGRPVRDRLAAWVTVSCGREFSPAAAVNPGCLDTRGSPAAVAEALSTAFMILPAREVGDLCRRYPGVEAWLIEESPEQGAAAPVLLNLPGAQCSGG